MELGIGFGECCMDRNKTVVEVVVRLHVWL